MKSIIILLCFLSVFYDGYTQNTAIPDVNFEKALIDLGHDTGNPDGLVPTANINTIITLNVSGKNINDLQGIQDFTALSSLICSNNNITDIKITNNTALNILQCENNNLASLNVSENIVLVQLSCSDNNLTTLDANKNGFLTSVTCFNNQLTSLNLKNGNNANIASFNATNNPNLTCIEVDNAAYSTANWTNIDVQTSFAESCTELAHIPDDNFEKALIDLGYDTGNPDDFVPVANIENVTALDVSNKGIADLSGIEYFTALSTLDCSDNTLISLNLSKNTALTIVLCKFNSISNLTLTENIAITELSCSNNNLTSLNVKNGNNTNFTLFTANNNPNLTCIDVDNAIYSNANWTNIDTQTTFSENCATLSVDDFLESNISVYPNPTNALVTIRLQNQIETTAIKTYDILGRQIDKTKANTVDLSNFSSGLYYIKLETNAGTLTKKVIKM